MVRILNIVLALASLLTAFAGPARAAPGEPSSKKTTIVIPIEGMIDLGLVPFVDRALKSAVETRATIVILEVNTFGGRVDAAVAIRDSLLRSRTPTVAFVNKRAISAGALISLAAERIVMARGATIGAATPVQLGQPGEPAKPVDEKSVSYVRKEFRATADARQRPGLIAEAMVDADVEIPELIQKGKLLTLTTEEAVRLKVADLEADNLDELRTKLELGDHELIRFHENWAERVVRFLTDPVVSSLLMTFAMLGILIELRTPGFGIPGAVGLLSLVAFFWGHWLVALVGWEQILLVAVGVLLLVLELFFIPGFGVAGALGIAAVVVGLSTSLVGAGASFGALAGAASRVAISTAAALVAGLLLMRFLPSLPGGRKLVLGTVLEGGGRSESTSALPSGTVGVTRTPLRPAGIASLAGRRVDVVSEGQFIEADQPIEVVRDEGTRVVVRRYPSAQPKGSAE